MNNPILQSKSKQFRETVENAPLVPGCYIYLDGKGTVLYVGKAKKLRNRIKSYFSNFSRLMTKTQNMIEQAESIELLEVDTEFEALILETNLIKKYRPKYNVLMKDDKNYVYIRFEKPRRKNMKPPTKTSVYQDFPRISVVRRKKDDGAEYLGPYPDARALYRVLKRIRKIFPYRTSKENVYIDYEKGNKIVSTAKKPDLYYHLGLSGGAEAGLESKDEYMKRFNKIRDIFKGKKVSIMQGLEREMKAASKAMEYEEAAAIRNKIEDLKYLTTNIRINNQTDDAVIDSMKEKQRNKAIDTIIEHLDFPEDRLQNHEGFRMECYDISNIQGKSAVGAMSVAVDGQLQPNMYRRFKIRMKNEPNDFAMLQEVLTRRFKRFLFSNDEDFDLPDELKKRAKNWKLDESFEQKPDLIVIDGGKGQLASTYRILHNFGLHNEIPIVGLAKREEEVFKLTDQFKDEYVNQINDSSQFTRILLPRRSEALFLFQRIRDEAHRFGITYHRKLRSRKMLEE